MLQWFRKNFSYEYDTNYWFYVLWHFNHFKWDDVALSDNQFVLKDVAVTDNNVVSLTSEMERFLISEIPFVWMFRFCV